MFSGVFNFFLGAIFASYLLFAKEHLGVQTRRVLYSWLPVERADRLLYVAALTGRTLYPAQVERLVIDLVAYRESLTREAIQDAGKQNLVSFARAPFLDYLGELLGVRRLAGAYKFDYRIAYVLPSALMLGVSAFLFRRRCG